MSNPDDRNLPPLPEEAHSALSAFRAERPSARLEARIHAALQAAEASESIEEKPRPSTGARGPRHSLVRMMLGGALASLVMVMMARDGGGARKSATQWAALTTSSPRELYVSLPEAGVGWVELPWNLAAHDGGDAMVHMEVPASLDLRRDSDLPALLLVGCEGDRCVHKFKTPTGAAVQPLRVRIHEPGRYEFRISHVSAASRVDEHFVVVANR